MTGFGTEHRARPTPERPPRYARPITHYERLGVSPTATADELRAAYRALARRLHPDVGGGDAERMAAVNEAWAVLSDPRRRAGYDATLRTDAVAAPTSTATWTVHDDSDLGDLMSPGEAQAARRLGCALGFTAILVAAILLALFIYAFTRSGSLQP